MDRIKEYYKSPRISNSLLGALQNPRYVYLKSKGLIVDEDEKIHFVKGAALDCLLTDPDRWDKDFMRVDGTRPTGLLGKFVNALPPGLSRFSALEEYREAYEAAGYKKSLLWVVDNFWNSPEVVEYYLAKNGDEVDGRILITNEIYDSVKRGKDLLLGFQHTREYLVSAVHNELQFQIPIYFRYRGQDCKALLDGLLIDHRDRTIKPYDIKTIGKPVTTFPSSFLEYGYYRQAAFYEVALMSEESPIKDLLEDGYRLDDFRFLVTEVYYKATRAPIIFETSQADRRKGIEGGRVNNIQYQGIDNLLDDYVWHTTNDLWEMPRSLYESNGVIKNIITWQEE